MKSYYNTIIEVENHQKQKLTEAEQRRLIASLPRQPHHYTRLTRMNRAFTGTVSRVLVMTGDALVATGERLKLPEHDYKGA